MAPEVDGAVLTWQQRHYMSGFLKAYNAHRAQKSALDKGGINHARCEINSWCDRCRSSVHWQLKQIAGQWNNISGTAEKKKGKDVGVREARTLDLRITRFSYETYALANCATTPLCLDWKLGLYGTTQF